MFVVPLPFYLIVFTCTHARYIHLAQTHAKYALHKSNKEWVGTSYICTIIHIPFSIIFSNTVSRSAIFCGVATTIERCKTEGVVDVFQVVKAMRVQKPGAIQTLV